MHRAFLLSALLAAAPAWGHGGTASATGASTTESLPAAADAAATVDAFSAALKAGRLEEVKRLLDPGVQVFESGHVEDGRDAYFAEHAAADALFLGSAQVTREARESGASGDTAWVSTRATIIRDGKRYASLETMVLHKGAEGWRIVHIHWSSRALDPRP